MVWVNLEICRFEPHSRVCHLPAGVTGPRGRVLPSTAAKDKRASGTMWGLLRHMFLTVTLSLSHVPLGKGSHTAEPQVKEEVMSSVWSWGGVKK